MAESATVGPEVEAEGAELAARADLVGARAGRMLETAFVLGNGPSLRGVDLTRFRGVATIGMNAAYREWERVGWYPRHYCCLDEELIATHHEAIRSLVVEGLVHSVFVTAQLLEYHPELAQDDRVFFLDSFRKAGRWRERRKQFGLPYAEEEAFMSSAPSKMTTGGYAVRYAIFLGYRRLYLLGIDCNYVEVIPAARKVGGIALEMASTPEENPNYFFDDYQQKGDRYNVPNPDEHGGNLHLQALEAVRDDVVERRIPVEIRNCSRRSKLVSEGTFPFEDLESALARPRLGAVAVPMTFSEEAAMTASLQRWTQPANAPLLSPVAGYTVPLVLVLNGAPDPGFEARMLDAFDASGLCPGTFSRLEFTYCELSADVDKYQRDYSKNAGPGGHKSGPNAQFFSSMKLLAEHGPYVFMMETDCVPIRPNWLGELERILESEQPFWVLGSLYRGVDEINERYRTHINGNAVYAVGDPEFQEFLTDVWFPALEEMRGKIRWLAYDCVLPLWLSGERPAPAGRKWQLWQEVAHRFRYTDFIQNHASAAELEGGQGYRVEAIRDASPSTYLVHGRHLLEERPASRFEAVAIHQMGKVGSRSLVNSVEEIGRWPVFHTHVLNVAENPGLDPSTKPEPPPRHTEVPTHIWESRNLRSRFLDRGRPVAIVTAVREPIGRNVSAFFQNFEGFVADGRIDDGDVDALYELFRREYPHDQPQRWLEEELNEPFGIDVFASPFPDVGYAGFGAGAHEILIVRASVADEEKSAAVAEFLESPGLAVGRINVTTQKAKRSGRTSILERFKQRVGRDVAYIDEMLGLPMALHFFSDEEREAVRSEWLELGRQEEAS